jgi:hypothetical protein
VTARIASGGSGGSFKLSADGVDITPAIAVPGTGGWQVWKTVQFGCALTAGTHDLRVHFLSTNVNLNRLSFSTLSNAVDTDERTPAEFRLEQNYPNPFNPNSDIRYQISEFGTVKLAVYDVLGREVALLVNEQQMPGSYTVRFDATGLSSGVYYYRLGSGGSSTTRAMVLSR